LSERRVQSPLLVHRFLVHEAQRCLQGSALRYSTSDQGAQIYVHYLFAKRNAAQGCVMGL